MRVKVLKSFKDKYTKERHQEGVELEVSKERFEEINSAPFGVLVEEITEEQKESSDKPPAEEAKKTTARKKDRASVKVNPSNDPAPPPAPKQPKK